jgi:hypothetical protein
VTTIRPEFLAAKFEAAESGEAGTSGFADQLGKKPRLPEALWFLQEMSRRPGSLERLVEKLILVFPDSFQTMAMHAAGAPAKGHSYSLEQCLRVWQEERHGHWLSDPILFLKDEGKAPPSEFESITFRDWLLWFIDPKATVK